MDFLEIDERDENTPIKVHMIGYYNSIISWFDCWNIRTFCNASFR